MEIDSTTTVHKVRFPESLDTFGHDSSILVQPLNDVHINVHLGFIQVNHRYEVRFQVLELKPVISSGSRYEVVLEFFAYKEKLLREQLLLQSCNNPQLTLTLMLNARVLGGAGAAWGKNKCYRWLNSKQKLQNPLLVTSAYLKSNQKSLLEKTSNSRLKPKKHGDRLHQLPPKAPDLAKPATGQNLMKRDSNVSRSGRGQELIDKRLMKAIVETSVLACSETVQALRLRHVTRLDLVGRSALNCCIRGKVWCLDGRW
ncbi:hypothetical protein MRX96_058566 [Rhipicephalus microplus]